MLANVLLDRILSINAVDDLVFGAIEKDGLGL